MKRILFVILALLAFIVVIAMTRGFGPGGPAVDDRGANGTASFDTGTLLVLSDADMAGTGYADGKTLQVAGQRDTLTLLGDLSGDTPTRSETFASNSVVGWPAASVTSSDGRYVYIIENQGEIDDAITKLDDPYNASPGRQVTAIRLDDGSLTATRLDVCTNPSAVSIMPDDSALMISCLDAERPVMRIDLADGVPFRAVPLAGAVPAPSERKSGFGFSRLSPDGRHVVTTSGDQNIQFFRIDGDRVEAIGEAITFPDMWLAMGRWSADGRHVVFADTGWGPGDMDAVLNKPGHLVSIAFDPDGAHREVSRVATSQSPEGMEFNPQGDLIAVANMERSYLPHGLPYDLFKRSDYSSLSLVTFDSKTGALRVVDGPVRTEAILPEDVMFDDDGDALALLSYQETKRGTPRSAWMDIYAIDDGPTIRPTGQRITLPRGAHDFEIVRGR